MIRQEEVQRFFDERAEHWDRDQNTDPEKIRRILDNAGVKQGSRVLDVACGTGVLIPYLLEREVARVIAVDLSPEMIRQARCKCSDGRVEFLCGDAAALQPVGEYDAILIYNAFPHFPDPEAMLKNLAGQLAPGGILTVAHGDGREGINAFHKGAADAVSNGLMEAEELAGLMGRYLEITELISEPDIYQVAGRRAPESV